MFDYSWKNLARRLYFHACIYSLNILSIVQGIILTSNLSCYISMVSTTPPRKFASSVPPWLSAILPLSAILSPLICTFISTKFGRKFTLLAISIPLVLAQAINVMTLCTVPFRTHLISHGLIGFSLGGISTILTSYIEELCACAKKMSLRQSHRAFFALGVLINYFTATDDILLNVIALSITGVFLVMLICFLPETPQFLIANKQELEGKDVLIKLTNSTMIDNDFRTFYDQCTNTPFYSNIMSIATKWRRRLARNLILITSKELSSAYVIYFHARDIFSQVTAMNALITSRLTYLTQVSWHTTWRPPSANTQLITLGIIQFTATCITVLFQKHINSHLSHKTQRATTRKAVMATCVTLLCVFGLVPVAVYMKFLSGDVSAIQKHEKYHYIRLMYEDYRKLHQKGPDYGYGDMLGDKKLNVLTLSSLSRNVEWSSWVPVLSFGVILTCYNVMNICVDYCVNDYHSKEIHFDDDEDDTEDEEETLSWGEEMYMRAICDCWTWALGFGICLVYNYLGIDRFWMLLGACASICCCGILMLFVYYLLKGFIKLCV